MIYIGSLFVFLFFIFTLLVRHNNEFCMTYVFIYLTIIIYAIIKLLHAIFNKK